MRMDHVEVSDKEELLGIAAAMEREAAGRYSDLAASMRDDGNDDTAELFERLQDEEMRHEDAIQRWAEREVGHRAAKVDFSWQMGEVFVPDEQVDVDASVLTPYRALSIAVHNEERAFSFYSYIAAYAEEESIRKTAEGLAREELQHAALLRKERRKAYHAQRLSRPHRLGFRLNDLAPRDRPDLAAVARIVEDRLAEEHATAAGRSTDREVKAIFAEIADAERAAYAALDGTPAATPNLPPGHTEVGGRGEASPREVLRQALFDLEDVCDFYFRVAETVKDEEALALAQDLARRKIESIARIRAHLS